MLLQGNDFIIAGHHHHRELQAFGQMHGADRQVAAEQSRRARPESCRGLPGNSRLADRPASWAAEHEQLEFVLAGRPLVIDPSARPQRPGSSASLPRTRMTGGGPLKPPYRCGLRRCC